MTGRARRQQRERTLDLANQATVRRLTPSEACELIDMHDRLDAIAAILDARHVVGTMVDPTILTLARGTPKRAVVQVLKRWGRHVDENAPPTRAERSRRR